MTRTARSICLAVTMLTCTGLAACGGSAGTAESTGTPTTTVTTAPAGTPVTTPTPSTTGTGTASPTPVAITTSTQDAAKESTLSDGKHAVLITGVDAAQQTVTLDVVQFFGGAAAKKAAAEDGGDAVNDYWIRNANPRLRTLPVTVSAKITVNALAWAETRSATTDVPKTLAELGRYRTTDGSLFDVTVAGGKVTGIAEVYLP